MPTGLSPAEATKPRTTAGIADELACYAALLGVTILVFWKITLTNQFTWLDSPDLTNQVVPWLQEQARQWQTGHFPVWDRHLWGGYPLAGQSQPGALYPLNWLLALTPLEGGHLRLSFLNWYFVLIHYMGVAFCFALCRDRGCGRYGSMLAGASFGLCGWVGTTAWPQMLNGAIWAPLVFLFLFRALDGYRPIFNSGLAGAMLGISTWSGHHQIPTFVALAAALACVGAVIANRLDWRRFVAVGASLAGFTFLIGAPSLLASHEFYTRALRWVGSKEAVTLKDTVPYMVFFNFSLNPAQLIGLIIPFQYGNVVLYVGLVVMSLAAIAVWQRWDRFEVRVMLGIAIASMVYAFGIFSMFHGVLYALLPGLDKSRNVAFAVFPFHFAMAVLAGYGWDALRAAMDRSEDGLRRLVTAVGLFSAGLYAILISRGTLQGDKVFESAPAAIAAFAALFLCLTLAAWRAGRLTSVAASACLSLVFLFEISSLTGWNYQHKEQGWSFLRRLFDHDDLADFLRNNLGQGRFDKDLQAVAYNLGDWYGLDEFMGNASMTTNLFRFAFNANTPKLLGVKYWVGNKPRYEGQRLVFDSRSGLKAYEEPGAFPRVWSVHEATSVQSENDLGAKMAAPLDELSHATFMLGTAPVLERCPARDHITLTRLATGLHTIDAEMACRGMVVLGNTYFPGWQATVDGKPAPVHEAYGCLQGVVVERGQHRVQFKYLPVSLLIGAALTAAGVLGLVVLRRYTSL